MKQRGRDRPFWDKGGGRPGERAPRETHGERDPREARGERGSRETRGERSLRESPGERAARAFDEREPRGGAGKPRRGRGDSERPREEWRPREGSRPQEGSRRRPEEFRPQREEGRPRQEAPRREHEAPRRDYEGPRQHVGPRKHFDELPEKPRLRQPPARKDGWRGRDAAHEQTGTRDEQRRGRDEQRRGRDGEHAGDGSLLFGLQPVLEALRAGQRPVERLTVVEGAHEARVQEVLELARAARVPVRRAPRAELHRLAAGANHQGIVASVAAARYAPAEDLLDALAARVGTDDPPLALVLDGVEDPRNLGAIIRTAECAGAHGLFVPERRAAGLTETAAKAAAGALEYVPVARATNLARLVEELKGRGVWAVGTAADAEVAYTDWDWTQPCALVLGGEGEGLRRLVRERCDVLVRIPLRGRIPSLNVSVAAAVLLYEAVRQRTAGRSGT